MPTKIFHGYRVKVFALISVLIIAMSVFFTVIVIYQQRNLLKQDLIDRGISVARNLAHDSELGVFTENHDFLDPVLRQNIKLEKDVLYAAIYNKNGKPIDVHSDDKGFIPHITTDIKEKIFEKRVEI